MNFANYLAPIQEWANANYQYFKKNGHGRQYGILQEFDVPDVVWQMKSEIVDFYKLQDKKQEPTFKDYCGYITEGGAIHKHTDGNQGNLIHCRYNVMISKPLNGGEPIQNGFVIKADEGDVWRCLAGRDVHWCNTVHGDKPRIVLSFGFLI